MSVQAKSRFEMVIEKATDTIAHSVVYGKGSPIVVKAAEQAGQACLAHPSLVVIGAVTAIAAKELSPHVTHHLKPVVDPVVAVTQKYPKITLLTTSTICSSFLPFAATGEPLSVTAATISCTAAAASLLAYMLKEEGRKQ